MAAWRAASRALRVAITALAAVAAIALPAAGAARAAATAWAPVNRPGPRLDVPAAKLAASLRCSASVRHSAREPVLLVPGTELTPAPNFSWNYEPALAAAGFPYCTLTLPEHANGDIQTAGEYVVYAIRTMHRLSGHRVQIIGYSQGGMVPRWALRFWPDTRRMVDDDIGLDASNHGTLDADFCTAAKHCPPAFWQQRSDARFIAALNSIKETFPGISYTEIYSDTDEVVFPNFGPRASSSVHGGGGQITNVAVQSICPNDTSDHLAMGTYDPVGWALALDALTHRGPADPARISRSVCATPLMPGVDPLTFPADYAAFGAFIASSVAHAPEASAEPPLRCYVFASGCRSRRR
jgi:triacylglycerol esterase/lipase EstA (alpha/beta hydrolase family)